MMPPPQPPFSASGAPATTSSWPEPAPQGTLPFPPPDAAIATWALTRSFGDRVAVGTLNLIVKRGEFFGFLGPNGAGKSTTIKMLVGLLRPTSGAAFVGGVDVWRDPLRAKALMGVLPEQLNLYERLSGRETVEFAGRLFDLPRAEVRRRTSALLDVLGLTPDADKLVIDYSVGMRKKVSLAAALIHRPQVLFLDEPFEGIDPISSRTIRDILRDLIASGTTIFFSSHIMEVVERLCTRVGIINHGQLIAEGTLEDLRKRAGAQANGDATLEDVFLTLVGAGVRAGGLEWLE
ncbi:MAG TPA: ABC transporter ATP-binding protein [Ktedonobacterales bacterium]